MTTTQNPTAPAVGPEFHQAAYAIAVLNAHIDDALAKDDKDLARRIIAARSEFRATRTRTFDDSGHCLECQGLYRHLGDCTA